MTVRSKGCWRASLRAGARLAPLAEALLEPLAVSTSRFLEDPESVDQEGDWIVAALFDADPPRAELSAALAEAASLAGTPAPDFDVEEVGETDWLALNRRQFPPVRAGRFFIHGSHFEGAVPAGLTALCLDAGRAFGSGTHGSTRGSLIAIDRCLASGPFERVLDIGCGSGILALALAASTQARVVASDWDAAAIETLRANAAANGLGERITALLEDGVGPGVRAHAPYGLVAANILAEPLIAMAADLGEVTAAGGILILSGLVAPQEQAVLAAYGEAAFAHRMTLVQGPWSTLVVTRRSRDARSRSGPG